MARYTCGKKAVSLFLIIFVIFSQFGVFAQSQYTDNLIDPLCADCESLAGFSDTYYSVSKAVDTGIFHSGAASVKVTIPSAYQDYLGIKLKDNLVEGETYKFSVWYYNPENITGRMFLRFCSVTGNSISNWVTGTAFDSGVAMTADGWQKYEYTFTPSSKLVTDLKYLYITTEQGAGKVIYFDDISLTVRDPKEDYLFMFDSGVAACESQVALDSFNTNSQSVENSARSISKEYAHSGTGSLCIEIPGTYKTYAGIAPKSPLKSGGKYYFSVWYYNPENISGKLYLRFCSVTGNSISNWITGTAFDSGVSLEEGGWHKYEYVFTATDKIATDLKYFYLTTDAGAGSNIYFDDFNLRLIPDAIATLEGVTPSNNTTDVKPCDDVRFEFSLDVDSTDVAAELYINGDMQNEDSFSFVSDGTALVLNTNGGFVPDAKYKLVINRVNDACGRLALENYTLTFSTSNKVSFNVNLYQGDSTPTSKLATGKQKVDFDLVNNMGTQVDCVAVVLVCEGETIKNVYTTKTISLNTDAQEFGVGALEIDVPSNSCYLKAFLWNSDVNNLRALSNSVEYR